MLRPFTFRRAAGASGRFTGILVRLRRDTRGNALAMMAAWMVPLVAFSGSALDMGRLYAVKTRLQQACDAGVLAGRKSMTDTTLDTSDSGQAQTFFKNNFRQGWFGTTNVRFTPTRTDDYQVSGTAVATVPMSIMAMFGQSSRTINVACQARYDVADADIMFVLDTTGSMACTATSDCNPSISNYTREDGSAGYYDVEVSGSKLSGLRSAVLSFYDTLASSTDSSTHIRYGFVPYTSTVNVGKLLYQASPSYLVTQWNYQSRRAVGDYTNSTSQSTVSASSSSDCSSKAQPRTPKLGTTVNPDGSTSTLYTYTKYGTATTIDASWDQKTTRNGNTSYICTLTTTTLIPIWRYAQWPFDVSGFVAGNSVADPSKISDGSAVPFYASKWQGCIEERQTTASSSFDQDNLPADLDPDLIPASDSTRWRPMWPDLIYYRSSNYANGYKDYTGDSTNPYGDTTDTGSYNNYTNMLIYNNVAKGYTTCGKQAQRLATMTRDQVSSYVNSADFKAIGGTYHDTGMIWGTRLISPNGIFKSDTAPWPGRQAPNRYIVFMTDGEMAPNQYVYGMYGLENLDRRVTGGSYSSDTDYHNARFVAECQAAKARNITVFVVGFGQTLNDQLKACASSGQAYYASDNASLTAAFQKIAQQVAMLRISK